MCADNNPEGFDCQGL